MLSGKRKQGFSGLQRRVKPRKEEEPEIDENHSSEPEGEDEEGDELSEDDEDDDEMNQDDDEEVKFHTKNISKHYSYNGAVRRVTPTKEAQSRHLISLLRRPRKSPSLHARKA